VVLITSGRLGDTYGRKRLFLIGVTWVHPHVGAVRSGAEPWHAHCQPSRARP
jgi:MFS family permease